jgi:hypothetical protein
MVGHTGHTGHTGTVRNIRTVPAMYYALDGDHKGLS